MTASRLLEAIDLHVSYRTGSILHGIDLTVDCGQALGLMGRNGMGKTTTIRTLFGLTPPTRGEVLIDGRNMTGAPPHRIARSGLALVPEGRGIFPTLTVAENLSMAARPARGETESWTLERVLGMFPPLAARLGTLGDRLSGGEQQMLAIGRALMTNPRLLVMDEATEGLAPKVRRQIWSVIAEIKNAGIATLIVDKDLGMLLRVCDRCLILAKGSVVYSGPSSDLAAKPDIHIRYLGV